MSSVTYRCEERPARLFRTTAEAIAEGLEEKLRKKPEVVLGLCGGRSAGNVLTRLRSLGISWERVQIFVVDERILPLDSPQRNFAVIEKSFVGPLLREGELPAENVHPFLPRSLYEDFGVAAYTEELQKAGGRYDVAFLSLGEDGHIASLFPRRSVLVDSPGHILVLDSPKPPPRRISASRSLLLKTQWAVLIAAGKEKRQAYRALRDPRSDVVSCPACLLKELEHTVVLTDIDCAAVSA